MFCSDLMSGSHFTAQTSIFLLIDTTAMTLSQGHGKVIQYISPDPYILCVKYLRFSSNGLDMRGKSCCGGGRGGNELKTDKTPRLGWLNKFHMGGLLTFALVSATSVHVLENWRFNMYISPEESTAMGVPSWENLQIKVKMTHPF